MTDILFPERIGNEVLLIKKVVYDFAVDGGAIGTHAITGAPTFPDKAVVQCFMIDVLTPFTSASNLGTFDLEVPTDGYIMTQQTTGNLSGGILVTGAGVTATGTKMTANRVPQFTVGTEDLTAGKAVFLFIYFISQ